MSLAATLTTTATLSIGTLAIFKRVVPSIGTSVTLLSDLSFANTSLLPLGFSWSAVAMQRNLHSGEFFYNLEQIKNPSQVISEDMVKDGYGDIMNVDISSVAIDMMRRKYEHIPQLKYMQMDVRDMSFFPDESFDGVIDKGTLDSLMCGTDAPISASQMLAEVSRLMKPGGTYMMITYGDPSVRMPHINKPVYNWKITLYIISRPGFQRPETSSSSPTANLEPVPTTDKGLLPPDYVLEDPDSHFIYVCQKVEDSELNDAPNYPLTSQLL